MKTLSVLSLFALLLFDGNAVQDEKWFDLENCAFCKSMANRLELITDTQCEVLPVSNGMIMVTIVPKEHQDAMKAAHEEMMQVVTKLEKGESVKMCGFCMSYGGLKMGGAKFEEFETDFGSVVLITSDDEEIVKKIHEHAKKTQAAHKEMKESIKSGKGGNG